MQKVHCKRCNGLILIQTANKYQGYSRQCLEKQKYEHQIEEPKIKEKSLVDLEIEHEKQIQELEKIEFQNMALKRIFIEKQENKSNILKVLDQLCFNLLGQTLGEICA